MPNFTPKKPEKDVISLRISTDLLGQIHEKIVDIDISRNEFIVQCIEFAMANMNQNEKE